MSFWPLKPRAVSSNPIADLEEDQVSFHTVRECNIECSECGGNPDPYLWIHTRCYQLLMASFDPSDRPSMKDIKDYAVDTGLINGKGYPRGPPGTILEGLSSKHTSCIIAESFKQSFFGKLPPEMRRRIAEFVGPCWYLAVLGEARRLIDYIRQCEKDVDEELDLDEDMWISRIVCQDHWYLSQISNMPIEATEGMEVFHIQPPQTIHKIIASTDQIGVRWIQFLNRETTPTQDQSPWYEIYDVEDFEPRLWVVSKVSNSILGIRASADVLRVL